MNQSDAENDPPWVLMDRCADPAELMIASAAPQTQKPIGTSARSIKSPVAREGTC
jgi:hypothetical protein